MKLYFLKDTALDQLKYNAGTNIKNYANETNEWLTDYFGESPFLEFSRGVPEFQLDDTIENVGCIDIENAKTLYTNLKAITVTQASDERFWSGLEHGQFWGYMRNRWGSYNTAGLKESSIMTHFFFVHGSKKSMFMNTLSRLWWLAKLTYDETRGEPFELLDFFKTDFATKIMLFSSNGYFSNFKITSALLETLIEYEKDGNRAGRRLFTSLSEYLNVLGGIYILDYLEKEEIKTLLNIKLGEIGS